MNRTTARTVFLRKIISATIPIVLVGLLVNQYLGDFLRSAQVVGFTTIFWGIILGLTDRIMPQEKDILDLGLKGAFFIGLFQILSLVPGTSRSGITMTAGRLIKMTRLESAYSKRSDAGPEIE